MTTVIVIAIYLGLLLGLALFSKTLFRGTSKDYFVASHSIGPFMLLMSVFGTTMTAFALVGSTGKAFERGIGTYGLMASSSGLIHAACFLLIGIKLWAIGKRYGYVTQIQYFRDRFETKAFGYLLFPILVLLVIPYLLIGIIGAGKTIAGVTGAKITPKGTIPGVFPEWTDNGAIPPWFTGLVISAVVLTYIFAGGSRAAAWANTFQTIVFMVMGVLAFYLISDRLGGLGAAIEQAKDSHKVRTLSEGGEIGVSHWTFLSYMFIPLSVGMFPHLFQHWLTAKSAKSFKLTVVAHPICIAIVWVPCVLIGIWATGLFASGIPSGAILAKTVGVLVKDPIIVGLVTAGILAAIMSSLDSQFLCLGTMFTNDIVLHRAKKEYSDKQILFMARGFIVAIVVLTYIVALLLYERSVFDLAIWCFSGFAALTPLIIAALYWKRATKVGAYSCVIAVFISWLTFFAMSGFGGEYFVFGGIVPAAIMWFIGAGAMIIGSLVSQPPSEETLTKFF
ncbi:MAG: sodium:solute symporter family protein [Akkermansiaceae bacterium]|nr:sodium:solute symporter family protein [Akkermansiaceae bacterium]MDG1363116.1 sodium:solute symporter family protein [Akkermansiaceae bacterium]